MVLTLVNLIGPGVLRCKLDVTLPRPKLNCLLVGLDLSEIILSLFPFILDV